MGRLTETYTFLQNHFDRGFKENHLSCNDEELVDHFLFDYYTEIFYYFYFSARDIIFQLLNVYLDLGFSEEKLNISKVVKASKSKNIEINELLELYYKNTGKGNEYRNSLTHRFPINQEDYRFVEEISLDGSKQYSKNEGDYLDSEKIFHNINEISRILSDFLKDLKSILEKAK